MSLGQSQISNPPHQDTYYVIASVMFLVRHNYFSAIVNFFEVHYREISNLIETYMNMILCSLNFISSCCHTHSRFSSRFNVIISLSNSLNLTQIFFYYYRRDEGYLLTFISTYIYYIYTYHAGSSQLLLRSVNFLTLPLFRATNFVT